MIKIQSVQSNIIILHSFMEHMIMIQHGQKHQTLSLGMNFCHMRQFQMLSMTEQIVLVHFARRPNIIGLCAKTKLWQADTGVAFTDSPSFSWPDSMVASPDGNCRTQSQCKCSTYPSVCPQPGTSFHFYLSMKISKGFRNNFSDN